MESSRWLERLVRGFSNHWRIEILNLLARQPELSVEEIAELLGAHYRTVSAHLLRLATAGLVLKRSAAQHVRHRLTDRGAQVLAFLNQLT